MSFVYAYLVKDGDREGIEKFDIMLNKPPEGVARDVIAELPEWRPEAQAASFFAQLGSRPPVWSPMDEAVDSQEDNDAGDEVN